MEGTIVNLTVGERLSRPTRFLSGGPNLNKELHDYTK